MSTTKSPLKLTFYSLIQPPPTPPRTPLPCLPSGSVCSLTSDHGSFIKIIPVKSRAAIYDIVEWECRFYLSSAQSVIWLRVGDEGCVSLCNTRHKFAQTAVAELIRVKWAAGKEMRNQHVAPLTTELVSQPVYRQKCASCITLHLLVVHLKAWITSVQIDEYDDIQLHCFRL